MATSLGFMLCVIPGFIVSGLFMLAIPLVVEGRLPATGALIQSWNALKSQWLVATVFHFVLILAALSGVLLCGVGISVHRPALLPGDRHPLPRLLLAPPSGLLEETSRAISRDLNPPASLALRIARRQRLGFVQRAVLQHCLTG